MDKYCQGFLFPKALCVAYSGGLDSSVLLDVAHKVCLQDGIALSAFHVNHGISENSMQWQSHCKNECESKSIPFFSHDLLLSKQPQKSLEALARDARYTLLGDYAKDTKIVLLAQHEDDQSETFLLQLKRGAGVKGLSAMPVYQRKTNGTAYLRPFLEQSRSSLLEYAQQHDVKWIEDESNLDNSYDRNFLRNQIVPKLVARWPAIQKTIVRSAHHCAQSQQVNTEYMSLLSHSLLDDSRALNISSFVQQSSATQSCFLRHWLAEFSLNPSSTMLDQLLRLSSHVQSDAAYVQLEKYGVERFAGKLQVIDMSPLSNLPESILLSWQDQKEIRLHEQLAIRTVDVNASSESGKQLLADVFSLPKQHVTCVFGGSNLRFKYSANRPSKKLKAWYQEWQISPLQRQQTPVFVYNGEVVAVGLRSIKISSDYNNNAHKVALVKLATSNRI